MTFVSIDLLLVIMPRESVVAQNILTSPTKDQWKFQGGWQESEFLKKKHGAKLDFLEGWGMQTKKTLPWEVYGYFLKPQNDWKRFKSRSTREYLPLLLWPLTAFPFHMYMNWTTLNKDLKSKLCLNYLHFMLIFKNELQDLFWGTEDPKKNKRL